jgi:glycosyltransferase EpsD
MICTFVGELSNRKNQAFLIDAMKRIKEKELPVKLLLVGEGGERANLEEQIKQLGLSEVIFMLGNREPVLPYLAITDLYVSASRIEGLPFNIMEAMACGLPILASATKGQTDLLDKTPEALYPEGDMEAFCNGVERICKSGAYGVGTCEYPVLERYRLASVFEENLALLKKGWC